MKKSPWIGLLLTLACILALSACDEIDRSQTPSSSTTTPPLEITEDTQEPETEPHVHAFGEWVTVQDPTCTTLGEQVRSCSCGAKETQSIEAIGHVEVIDAAVVPTCTSYGKTEGKHCSVCGDKIVPQKIIIKADHTAAIDDAVPSTCTETGLTEGKHCSVCGEILVAQAITPPEHSWGNWSIIKRATSSAEGERAHTCTACHTTEHDVIDIRRYNGSLGSAGKISDTTVIVSIFANDTGTSWDFDSDEDKNRLDHFHTELSEAVNWLETECKAYGANTKFVFDWKTHSDLFYTFDFSMNMIRDDGETYQAQRASISHINSADLKQKHNAQNILYIVYFNTPGKLDFPSGIAFCDIGATNIGAEIVNIFSTHANSYVLAHEILHCFGAHDLYYSSAAIPQAYVNHCKYIRSMDIMGSGPYRLSDAEFTELCAYYVGLTDTCADVEKWNLATSTHLRS